MSLTRCPECEYETLSTHAISCPCCGAHIQDMVKQENQKQWANKEYFALYVLSFIFPALGIVAYVFFMSVESKYKNYVGKKCLKLAVYALIITIIVIFICIIGSARSTLSGFSR